MIKRTFGFCFLLIYFLGFPTSVRAVTKTLPIIDDTYINGTSGRTNNNYGDYPSLKISGQLTNYLMMLMKFNLDEIPQNQQLKSAKLKIYYRQLIDDNQLASTPLLISLINSPWDEAGVTWSNRPNRGEAYEPLSELKITNQAPGYQEWDITTLVQKWVNQEILNYGIYLEVPASDWYSGFDSSEGQYTPKIEVEYNTLYIGSFIKPIINIIPGVNFLISPTPLPSPTPIPTPTATVNPTIQPTLSLTSTPPPSPTTIRQPTTAPQIINEEIKKETSNETVRENQKAEGLEINWFTLLLAGISLFSFTATLILAACRLLGKTIPNWSIQKTMTVLVILLMLGMASLAMLVGFLILPLLLSRL